MFCHVYTGSGIRKAFHGIFYQQNVHRICISGRWCNDLSFLCSHYRHRAALFQSFCTVPFTKSPLQVLIYRWGHGKCIFTSHENDFSFGAEKHFFSPHVWAGKSVFRWKKPTERGTKNDVYGPFFSKWKTVVVKIRMTR